MCGIAGLLSLNDSDEQRRAAVARMCDALQHRGPDDRGQISRGPATLGMRRLAIIDPAGGHQPMTSADGRYHLVFNGCIYNYRELRADLAAGGYPFQSHCDTEVLLAAFARWGEDCLHRLRGMFAFAVWEEPARSLFLARDAFGIKPLYYHRDGPQGRFVFASELNALLASGLVARRFDALAVAEYLAYFAVPAPRTIYADVLSLRPGECARLTGGRLEVKRWWRFPAAGAGAPACRTPEQFHHELCARLDDTVQAHRIADVPVGAFLSGGLDSSGIVALMTRAGAAHLKTFSLIFEETGFSEAAPARRAAAALGTEHHETVLTGRQVAADLDRLLNVFDQPTGDGINTFYVSRAARAGGVKVALSGLGGDELFGGYPSFRDLPRLARLLPWWRSVPGTMRKWITRWLAGGSVRQRKLADFLAHARDLQGLCALQRRVFSSARGQALLHPDARAAVGAAFHDHPCLADLPGELAGADSFQIISAWELRTYMADVLLRDSDVMSMAQSLELRVPFIDGTFIAWLWAQPAGFKAGGGPAKAALAAALREVLPEDIRRREKRGFTLPFPVWMRRELKPFLEDTFAAASVARTNLLDSGTVAACWRAFLAGRDEREWSRVWSLAVLIAFLNRGTAP
ncbi:MAG TPA: asparagine synthase (glutamine-hydrolyzing) [Opitutaceae bacterium]|nr:asparagine synthase (glutamine-hydrolyzing) [Opitutaceae bacterium]